MLPLVRLVVLNFNGGPELLDCIASIEALDWPIDRREIVVVDNASSDGSIHALRAAHPATTVIENTTNTGFSANNLGIDAPGDWDLLAMVNPDTVVTAGWLRSLAAALTDNDLGAVTPKMLLAHRFLLLPVRPVVDAVPADISVERIEVDGVDVTALHHKYADLLQHRHHPVRDAMVPATLVVPVPASPSDVGTDRHHVGVTLACDVETGRTAPITIGSTVVALANGSVAVEVDVDDEAVAMVNNTGIALTEDLHGADRDLGTVDGPGSTTPDEVFGWSGGGALLRRAYLDDVGGFDPLFFLYYEDLDLSWRGRSRGWRYRHVPDAVMYHHHALSTGAGSDLFQFQNERNRLLVIATHAPARILARTLVAFVIAIGGHLRADVVRARAAGRPTSWATVIRRTRVLGSVVASTPTILRRRHRHRSRATTTVDLGAWSTPPRP